MATYRQGDPGPPLHHPPSPGKSSTALYLSSLPAGTQDPVSMPDMADLYNLPVIILLVLMYQGLFQTLEHPPAEAKQVHQLLTKHEEKQRAERVIGLKHLQLYPTSFYRFPVLS